MILYSSRSAKSVACSRLNVIGVRAFFFLPVLVAALTRADEFHSVTKTRWPSAVSHFASNPSCVVLPDPSIPSTTKSLPGYSWRFVRLFITFPAHLDVKRPSYKSLEGGSLAGNRPQLELSIAGCPDLQNPIVAAIAKINLRNQLRMTAIETFSQAQNCGKP